MHEGCCKLIAYPNNPNAAPGEVINFYAECRMPIAEKVWAMVTNNSGGSITSDGVYTAGNIIGAVDVISVTTTEDCEDGIVNVHIVCPNIHMTGPSSVAVGNTGQYSASGGVAPYTWSVDHPEFATINPNTGLLTSVSEGTVVVKATDMEGCSSNFTVEIKPLILCNTIYSNNFDETESGYFTGAWNTCSQLAIPGDPYCVGQDDWKLGLPAPPQPPRGKCGDPTAAQSSGNVWGNDLGLGSNDGCYSYSVKNYLISPQIIGSGYENMEIRFKAWVNVGDRSSAAFKICCGTCNTLTDFLDAWTLTTTTSSVWSSKSFSLPSLLCDGKEMSFAFYLETWKNGITAGGWNIDNFSVCGNPINP